MILITGCSSGIGEHLAHRLHQHGYDVVASCRREKDRDALIAKGIKSILLDVSHPESLKNGFHQAMNIAEHKKLDAIINNAGFVLPGAIEDLSREALQAQFETNVFGVLELMQLALNSMRCQNKGRIINISSIFGVFPWAYTGAYNASKFALEGLTRTLQLELKGSGIHASIIQPGPIATKIQKNVLKQPLSHIDIEHSFFRAQYEKMLEDAKLNKSSIFTKPPEAVFKKVQHALTAKKPKVCYPVTTPAHVICFLKRLLPEKSFMKILRQLST